MKKLFIIACLFLAFPVLGQTPDWATGAAPVLYKNCTSCHHPGGIAPFSLLEYTDATAHQMAIKYQVENELMPPWPADPDYRRYAHERVLSASDRATLLNWIEKGAAQGDPNKAPAKPVYGSGPQGGAYDLKLKIPQYTSQATSSDVYRCFVIPTGLSSERFIRSMEIIPGNPEIVHHVLVFQDTTNVPGNLDKADPLPGYTNFGGTGSNASVLLAPYAPGSGPLDFPTGTGIRLFRNANIVLQIHYPAGTQSKVDSTYVILRFGKSSGTREVFISPVLNHSNITNGPFMIPANQVKTFYQSMTVPFTASLLSVMPHMHLIGKSVKVFAKPLASDTIPLVYIPDWDFHWQGQYKFRYVQKINTGTRIQSVVTYDNTTANEHQPSNPPKTVYPGEATTDEMMLTYFYFMTYQDGDENILQDSSLLTAGLPSPVRKADIAVYPNPAADVLTLPSSISVKSFSISDPLGRIVREGDGFKGGENRISLGEIPEGWYRLQIVTTEGYVYTTRFIRK